MRAPAQPIAARGVVVRYGDLRALDGADVAARAGEVLALLGPSGAGKSTLLRVLHLLEAPESGEVLVDGSPAPRDAAGRLAALRRMALVQQRPGFLRASALDNVAFPLLARGVPRREARERAREALAAMGLDARAAEHALLLSGGEAQRVGMARALVARPDVLFLDEFTNQLDPENEDRLEAVARAERDRGAAVVLVTHSVAQARRLADRVAFLDRGRVVEEGPAARVLSAPTHPLVARFVARA